ncbi:ComEC/Rec2 family competence protein [Kineococcus sp. SYSU DK003]|uniref:ComEC/Rec2 family competence protein n=1 Tax=Kineococcus sp. SYSU DK003 TaxID=3383124 RepID=UPI003D7F1647
MSAGRAVGPPPVALDLRLAALAGGAWGTAFWATGSPHLGWRAVVAGAAALLVTVTGLVLVRRGARVVLVACGCLLVLFSVAVQHSRSSSGGVAELAERRVSGTVTATVGSDPRELASREGRPPRVVLDVRLTGLTGRGTTTALSTPATVFADAQAWRDVRFGEQIEFDGRWGPADPGERSLVLVSASGPPVAAGAPGPALRAAEHLRSGLRQAVSGQPADARGLLPGLVVGDTSALPADLEAAMRQVGLTHLTAVSGSNTTLVVGFLVLVASWLGFGRRSRLLVAGVGLVGFVVLARPEPSVLRAAVMGGVGMAGLAAGRPVRGIPVVAAAVVVLLVADPWLAREFGFVLSALATSALVLFARPWADRLAEAGAPRPLAYAVAVPVAAQAVCGPVVVLLQPSVNLVSIPANVLVAPAVAPATVIGLGATLLATVWPAGAAVLAWPAGSCTWWIAVVARAGAELPTALPVPSGAVGAAVVAVLTALLLGAVAAVVRFRRQGGERRGAGRPWLAAAAVLALAGALLVRCAPGWGGPSGPWPPPDWLVVGCDVGQGDAFVLRSGQRSAVLVDAGPDDVLVDGCLDRLDVERLDAVVLTHFHADHVGGLAGALEGREVGTVLVSPLAVDPAAGRVSGTAAQAGADVTVAQAGQEGAAGRVSWTVLGPEPAAGRVRAPDSAQVNDASVSLLAQVAGVRVLLTGDLEDGGQRRLLARLPAGTTVDVVKVAHHGSATQFEDLYATVRPRVALVGVGEGNDHGHPAPGTLDLLAGTGARVLRTDTGGDVAVVGTAGELRTLVRGSDATQADRRARYSAG